ncbi:MAG: hypothetical protein JOY80_11300 [Candidatus Dormibacteraeota bacterium]|nr:hypothetical protein [Candidatus Dormibacteraeota bacterium]
MDEELLVIVDGPASGAENMRRDSGLLRRCVTGEIARALRLYWFEPACLSLGRMQPDSDVDVAACARDGVDIVRRPSGGRAVLHRDEVTYALVCAADDPVFGGDVLTSCGRIHATVADSLRGLGIATSSHVTEAGERRHMRRRMEEANCFANPSAHELIDSTGSKLVGSAQVRNGHALLQHGSILLEPSGADDYLAARAGRNGLHPPTPGLRRLAGQDLSRLQVVEALATAFLTASCAEDSLTPHYDVL